MPGLDERTLALPRVDVYLDVENQKVVLDFDPDRFKRWDWVKVALYMAMEEAELKCKTAHAMDFQRKQHRAAQTAVQAAQVAAQIAELRKTVQG